VRGAVGDTLARDMLLAASVHGAQRLYEAGFLLSVLPDAEVATQALACAARIAALAPEAARANKRTLAAASAESLLATAYDYADSPEHREGIAAFIAKRPPVF
jgi:enoyl-CoA hydratase